jgi:hypothetical protein
LTRACSIKRRSGRFDFLISERILSRVQSSSLLMKLYHINLNLRVNTVKILRLVEIDTFFTSIILQLFKSAFTFSPEFRDGRIKV